MDYAATTPTDQAVVDAMTPFFQNVFGNPSSLHSFGQEAKYAVEAARQTIAASIAEKARLPVATKAESQDICFVTGNGYGQFIREMGGTAEPGPIVDMSGREVGRHEGIAFYTIGQRLGLRLATREPLHVVSIEAEKNRVVVGPKKYLKASVLFAGDFNFLAEEMPVRGEAKIRYRKHAAECTISITGDRIRVDFHDPQESITPGQAVVLYRGDEVLGGGIIEEVLNATC